MFVKSPSNVTPFAIKIKSIKVIPSKKGYLLGSKTCPLILIIFSLTKLLFEDITSLSFGFKFTTCLALKIFSKSIETTSFSTPLSDLKIYALRLKADSVNPPAELIRVLASKFLFSSYWPGIITSPSTETAFLISSPTALASIMSPSFKIYSSKFSFSTVSIFL